MQKRPAYNIHDLQSETLIRLLKKEKIIKIKDKSKQIFLKAMTYIANASEDSYVLLTQGLSDNAVVEEFRWMFYSERIILFPQNAQLLDNILKCQYNLERIAVDIPFSIFQLAFPKGYRLAEEEALGCMVSIRSMEDNLIYYNKMMTGMGFNAKKDIIDPSGRIADRKERVVCITYFSASDRNKPKHQRQLYRTSFPLNMLEDIIQCRNYQDYHQVLGDCQSTHDAEKSLSEAEYAFQFELVRLVFSLLVYIQATGQETIKEALPGQFRRFIQSQMAPGVAKPVQLNTPEKTGSGIKTDNASRKAHYRRWTIRVLRDEKYYRVEWEDKPRGSRLAFVHDCWVGEKISPKTIVGKKS